MTNRFCGSVSTSISGEGPKLINPLREAELKFLQRSVSPCGGTRSRGERIGGQRRSRFGSSRRGKIRRGGDPRKMREGWPQEQRPIKRSALGGSPAAQFLEGDPLIFVLHQVFALGINVFRFALLITVHDFYCFHFAPSKSIFGPSRLHGSK